MALVVGLATALFGVVFAAAQVDMKRLLAYSSIENIGLIVVGLGLAIIFAAYRMHSLAALALVAALYHCLNHALFKSLLFLGTGSVLHATQERNLGKLGGLMRYMPWVAWTTLVGVIASAGLPPSNGFVSEWLLLQGFLFTGALPNPYLRMLVPVFAAGVVLVAALAGYVMVKFFGIIFLGRPREEKLAQAHDAGGLERLGLLWLTAGCILLGLFPVAVIEVIDPITVHARRPRARAERARGRLAAPRPGVGGARLLQPDPLPPRHRRGGRGHHRPRAALLPRARAPRRALGLRLSRADGAHAGHRRGLRPADPPDLRALLPA